MIYTPFIEIATMGVATLVTAIQTYTQTVRDRLAGLEAGKVDTLPDHQLSQENYTSLEKTKLASVGSMGQRQVTIAVTAPDDAVGEDGDVWLWVQG